jgi:hypothetical protein
MTRLTKGAGRRRGGRWFGATVLDEEEERRGAGSPKEGGVARVAALQPNSGDGRGGGVPMLEHPLDGVVGLRGGGVARVAKAGSGKERGSAVVTGALYRRHGGEGGRAAGGAMRSEACGEGGGLARRGRQRPDRGAGAGDVRPAPK